MNLAHQDPSMKYLRDLTERLPEFEDLLGQIHLTSGVMRLSQGGVEAQGWTLHNDQHVSVGRWHLDTGLEWPLHRHAEAEGVFVYRGAMTIVREDGRRILLLPGDGITLRPDELHRATDVLDCWLIVTHHPPSSDYPYER